MPTCAARRAVPRRWPTTTSASRAASPTAASSTQCASTSRSTPDRPPECRIAACATCATRTPCSSPSTVDAPSRSCATASRSRLRRTSRRSSPQTPLATGCSKSVRRAAHGPVGVEAMAEGLGRGRDAVASVPWMVDAERSGPSCTAVAAVWDGDSVTLGWAGDSRAYWVGDDGIRLLTRDHSWAQEQVTSGAMTAGCGRARPSGPRDHPLAGRRRARGSRHGEVDAARAPAASCSAPTGCGT